MGIVVIGAAFVDVKGFPNDSYIPDGRNAGRVEYVHGGVSRNVVEDIANVELRPVYLGLVDDSPLGVAVVERLKNHKVNCDYVRVVPDGMGTWLAVFDNNGDVAGSISKRPNLDPIMDILEEDGDEIFSQADSVIIQVDDVNINILKKIIALAKKHEKKLFGLVANMSIAAKRRDLLQDFDCFICNRQEAGILFLDDFSDYSREKLCDVLSAKVVNAKIPAMIVTMGGDGAVYATKDGEKGACPARNVIVKDTTGAGDAFCAGASIGLTYGKTMSEAIEIGSHLAASVITSSENVCPRFLPQEVGIDIEVELD